MANEMIAKNFGKMKLADVFKNQVADNDLGAGVVGGFGVIGFKGKVWSRRKSGEEELLMRPDGDGPRSSIDVVVLQASKTLSKVWYEKGYVDGNSAPPDCWSNDAIRPDPTSPKIQSPTCGSCPRNIWGGRITENGKRAKECGDAKRLAVAFIDELEEVELEPELLRVPAASLADLKTYGDELSKLGYPYFAVATKITFDPEEAYPKFKFQGVRPLTGEEGTKVIEMREDTLIDRILGETSEAALVDGDRRPAMVAALPPAAKQPKTINAEVEPTPAKSEVKPRGRKKAVAAPPPEEVEEAEEVTEEVTDEATTLAAGGDGEEDDDFAAALDAKLSGFLSDKIKAKK